MSVKKDEPILIWANPALRRHLAFKIKCTLCGEHWLEDAGHLCPEVPTPRRREAVLATRAKDA